MKVIRILDAGVFADERGNIIPDNEFLIASHTRGLLVYSDREQSA